MPLQCIVTALLVLLAAGLAMAESDAASRPADETGDQPQHRHVSVTLMQSVANVRGLDVERWPRHEAGPLAGRLRRSVSLVEPHIVNIRLPDSRNLALISSMTSFIQFEGNITDVEWVPELELLSWPQAVRELENILRYLDITPDQQFIQTLQRWRSWNLGDDPTGLPIRGGTAAYEKTGLYIRLQPHTSGNGWFIVLTLYVEPEHRPSAQNKTRLATQPASGPEEEDATKEKR